MAETDTNFRERLEPPPPTDWPKHKAPSPPLPLPLPGLAAPPPPPAAAAAPPPRPRLRHHGRHLGGEGEQIRDAHLALGDGHGLEEGGGGGGVQLLAVTGRLQPPALVTPAGKSVYKFIISSFHHFIIS